MADDITERLRTDTEHDCVRIGGRRCCTRRCLVRGGYIEGTFDPDIATCEAWERRQAADTIDALRELLDAHHQHHLQKGTIGLPDGEGGWIEIDNAAEYADSSLYEKTVAAIEGRTVSADQRLTNIIAHVRKFIDGDCTLDAMEAALDDAYGEAEDAADHIDALRRDVGELREALKPFAVMADLFRDDVANFSLWDGRTDHGRGRITLDDCRTARAILARLTAESGQ